MEQIDDTRALLRMYRRERIETIVVRALAAVLLAVAAWVVLP